jgi:glycine cleavage system H protein
VESVKAASEIYLPVAGTVVAVNDDLKTKPELINQDPYGAGWIAKIKITDAAGLAGLLDAAAYAQHCAERKH